MPYLGDNECPKIGNCHCNCFIDGIATCCWCNATPNGPMEGAQPEEDEWLLFVDDDEEPKP